MDNGVVQLLTVLVFIHIRCERKNASHALNGVRCRQFSGQRLGFHVCKIIKLHIMATPETG